MTSGVVVTSNRSSGYAVESGMDIAYPFPYQNRQIKQNVSIFECQIHDKEIREFAKGDGLFNRGIKKFQSLPFEKQVELIIKLDELIEFDESKMECKVNLGRRAGKYKITILAHPQVYRIEPGGGISDRNPFLNGGNICLGNMTETYNKCYNNKNYIECLKIVNAVLKSRNDSHGYRRWRYCK